MKRKEANEEIKVNGYYIKEFSQGFFGEHNEGKEMLRKMGLEDNDVPFSIAVLFQSQKVFWKDREGNIASVWFTIKPEQMECFGNYLGKQKSIRLFREWDIHEDPETIARLESEAIGDLCMRCIYENLV